VSRTPSHESAPNRLRDVVVVGVDGSQPGTQALIWALREGAMLGWAVEVVTAWPAAGAVLVHEVPGHHSEPRSLAVSAQEQSLARALAAVDEPPAVVRSVVNAHPVDALIERAADARLLVVGSHGPGPSPDPHHASVGDTLTLLCACPVVIVRPDARTFTPLDREEPSSHATSTRWS
jgi:nucleotide-binding universal stress UspA family protein